MEGQACGLRPALWPTTESAGRCSKGARACQTAILGAPNCPEREQIDVLKSNWPLQTVQPTLSGRRQCVFYSLCSKLARDLRGLWSPQEVNEIALATKDGCRKGKLQE
eukprot:scaffold293641_cov30-Tisochrysis_lutea.AAC.1